MKIFLFKIKQINFVTFIRFCEGLDITIIAAWKIEGDFLSADLIEGYLRIDKSNLSEDLQLEKLNEKYGNQIKPV
jgi:hypothetical protein